MAALAFIGGAIYFAAHGHHGAMMFFSACLLSAIIALLYIRDKTQ